MVKYATMGHYMSVLRVTSAGQIIPQHDFSTDNVCKQEPPKWNCEYVWL